MSMMSDIAKNMASSVRMRRKNETKRKTGVAGSDQSTATDGRKPGTKRKTKLDLKKSQRGKKQDEKDSSSKDQKKKPEKENSSKNQKKNKEKDSSSKNQKKNKEKDSSSKKEKDPKKKPETKENSSKTQKKCREQKENSSKTMKKCREQKDLTSCKTQKGKKSVKKVMTLDLDDEQGSKGALSKEVIKAETPITDFDKNEKQEMTGGGGKNNAAAPHGASSTTKESDSKRPNKKKTKRKEPRKVWIGEEAAAKFYTKCNDIPKLRADYAILESLGCNKPTEAFDANTERNRVKAPRIYDYNRVVLNRPGQDNNNYINATFITVKDFANKLIIAQLPRMENESFVEDFWHMIYQEQITLVYLLVADLTLVKAPTQLFQPKNGDYQYVGKMFINNRRAEDKGDPKEYTIEVLPEGNSDSIICQVHHHAKWQQARQPPKTHRIIKMIHQFLTEKEVQAAGVCVVSEFGSGRACSFIVALVAINQLNKGIEPNIFDIVTNIKAQRPGATESFAQYAGIFAIVLDYIRRKRACKTDEINKTLTRLIDDLRDISPPLTMN